MASFYKRKLKGREVWYANVLLKSGKRKSFNTECTTKAAAQRVAADVEKNILLGYDPFRKGARGGLLPLSEVVPDYLKSKRDDWGNRTGVLHEHTLKLLAQELGNVSLVEIGDAELVRFTAAIRADVNGKPRSNATVNIDIRNVKAFLNWCKETYDPRDWKQPRVKQLRQPERAHRDFYGPEEAEALVRAAHAIEINGESFGRYIAFLLLTGFRMREALLLKWQGIHRASNMIMLSQTKSGNPETFPITRELQALLDTWPEHTPTSRLFSFSAWSGHITTCWRRAVTDAGIRPLKLHNCRDSFAVNLLLEGVPLSIVSRLLRHSSITVTMQNYAGFSSEDIARVLENEKPRQKHGAYFTKILQGLSK